MRKLLSASITLLLSACLEPASTAPGAPEVWPEYNEVEREYVEPRLTEIAETPEPEGAVLFVGDSITQGADLASLFPGQAVSNHGIAADRTQGVLHRMDQITRGTPSKIFLMIGTNDLHQDGAEPSRIASRVGTIIDTLRDREPQAELHVVGILPRAASMAEAVAEANMGIRDEAERAGVTYIDLTSVMADGDGKIRDELTYDDLHLSKEGYRVWADSLRPCVEGDCTGGYWSRVRSIGRSAERDGALTFGWPGSGIAFVADGDAVVRLRDSGLNQFDFTVDGETTLYQPDEGISELRIEGRGEPVEVRLTRRSESYASSLTDVLSVEGDVKPLEHDGPRILFIGDSITAGFGTIGADETCPYSIETSSARDAYALMAAEELGAEAHLVAISGRGVVYNWDDNPEPHMLGHFDLALPDTLERWDHSQWTPDAVVVALGTNDFGTIDPGTAFAGNYATLLNRIATEYPEAKVFAVTGPLLTDEKDERMEAGIRDAISRVGKRGMDVTLVETDLADSGHVWGCNYHAGPDSNRRMAKELLEAITAETGWSTRG